MAELIQAIRRYGPRLDLQPIAEVDEIVEMMLPRTGLNLSQVMAVLLELDDLLKTVIARGTPVRLPGVGILRPSISARGEIRVNLSLDRAFREYLNEPGAYKGRILNQETIGMDEAGYKALWDAEFPGDPLNV